MDATNLPWPFWIVIGTVGYSGLSLLQRSITKEKIKEREAAGEDTEEPVGNPFFSNDDFIRRGVSESLFGCTITNHANCSQSLPNHMMTMSTDDFPCSLCPRSTMTTSTS
jgi:hypothetical protein